MSEVANTNQGSTAVGALLGLKQGLSNVAQTIVVKGGDPFLRLLRDGSWVYGAENTEVQDGSLWAINPLSIQHGFVSWSDNKKGSNEVLGEVMVPMTQPLPSQGELRDTGTRWDQQLAFQVSCVTGDDVGTQVLYKATSVGGMNAIKGLIGDIMKQLDKDGAKPVPVVELQNDSYMHKTYGKTYVPIFAVKRWEALDATELTGEVEPSKQVESKRRAPVAETKAETAAEEPPFDADPPAPAGDAPIRRRRPAA